LFCCSDALINPLGVAPALVRSPASVARGRFRRHPRGGPRARAERRCFGSSRRAPFRYIHRGVVDAGNTSSPASFLPFVVGDVGKTRFALISRTTALVIRIRSALPQRRGRVENIISIALASSHAYLPACLGGYIERQEETVVVCVTPTCCACAGKASHAKNGRRPRRQRPLNECVW